jgi:hypothetical protein
MNCREFLDLLQWRLDGEVLGPGPESEEHLRVCPSCAERHEAARRLWEALRLMTPTVPPPGLGPRVALLAVRRIRRQRLARRATIAVALAAGILLAAAVRFFAAPNRLAVENLELAKRSAPTTVGPPSPKPESASPALRDAVAEAGEAVARLTSRTADEAVGQTRLFLPVVPGPSLGDLELPSPGVPARPLRQAGENVTAGLQPVADSARRAIELFIRDLPPVGSDGRGGS